MPGYLNTQLKTVDTEAGAVRQSERLWAVYGSLISRLGDGPILDIGPGRGELLEVLSSKLRQNSGRIFSMDIDAEVVERLNQRYPELTNLHGDPVELVGGEQREYSAIFMLHVLEHLDVDYAVRLLTEIRNHLTEDGILVLEVPNSACSYVGNTIFSSDVTHKTAYTSVSLRQVCSMAGFDSIEIAGIRPTGSGMARLIQRATIAILISADRLLHKIFLPSWRFLHEATIFAVCAKRLP